MKTHLAEWSVSHDRLLSVLDYDPQTGIFIWKVRIGRRGVSTVGQRAGSVDPNGYRYIKIDGKWYLAQKLAWFYVNSAWPERKMGFVNGNGDDCRIENLKVALYQKNGPWRQEYDRKHRAENPEIYRGYQLKKDFGIGLTEYQAMFVAQNGVCAICAQPERDTHSGKVKALAVDHHHETGAMRGLLCSGCNTGLGKLGDDPIRLRAAADYIERFAATVSDRVVPIIGRKRNV